MNGRAPHRGPLSNPRWERFAQLLAAGSSQVDAYQAAGYKRHRGSAAELRANPLVAERVSELQGAGAQETVRAVSEKQRFIAAGWKAVADALGRIVPEDAAEVKALVDAVLAAEKDERVNTGGVSDRTASGIDDADTNREEAEREMLEMLEALARRTRRDTE
jgi:hypothetical protein